MVIKRVILRSQSSFMKDINSYEKLANNIIEMFLSFEQTINSLTTQN